RLCRQLGRWRLADLAAGLADARGPQHRGVVVTEREWLKSNSLKGLAGLLDRLCRTKRRPSDRRLRLFAAGFWRWQAHLKPRPAERLLGAVALAEEWAEGGARPEGRSAFRDFVVAKEDACTAAKETVLFFRKRPKYSREQERVPLL